ncbi:hypothetical protein TSUD_153900 [Trifolium subterraneum]|uniref:Uncharacterized protein n=1 Tax=Trifolium subterraneum TaxID=3900 RepID=A0A2Z6M8Y4_TRISU|nr:hypothetical protein TSUD_153900 [Trifolium subterraneum]
MTSKILEKFDITDSKAFVKVPTMSQSFNETTMEYYRDEKLVWYFKKHKTGQIYNYDDPMAGVTENVEVQANLMHW